MNTGLKQEELIFNSIFGNPDAKSYRSFVPYYYNDILFPQHKEKGVFVAHKEVQCCTIQNLDQYRFLGCFMWDKLNDLVGEKKAESIRKCMFKKFAEKEIEDNSIAPKYHEILQCIRELESDSSVKDSKRIKLIQKFFSNYNIDYYCRFDAVMEYYIPALKKPTRMALCDNFIKNLNALADSKLIDEDHYNEAIDRFKLAATSSEFYKEDSEGLKA